jgi:O-antigen/teichoic acid export membrane protein
MCAHGKALTVMPERYWNAYLRLTQMKKNVLSGAVFSGTNVVITFLTYPIYLFFLKAELYGVWATVAVILTFTQFGELGIGTAITKFIAGASARNNDQAITEFCTTAFVIMLIPSSLILAMVILFHEIVAGFMKIDTVMPNGALLVMLVGILSIFSMFVHVLRGIVVGVGRLDMANYCFLTARIFQVILAVIMLTNGYGIWSLYAAFVFYYGIIALVLISYLSRSCCVQLLSRNGFSKVKLRELMKYGGSFSVSMILGMCLMPFNKIMIARYVGLSEVTYFQIAEQVTMSLRNIFVKGLEALLPKVSEVKERSGEFIQTVSELHRKGMRLIYACALPGFLIIFLFAQWLLSMWLQDNFSSAIVTALQILTIAWFVNLLSAPDYYLLMGLGRMRPIVQESVIRVLINAGIVLWIVLWGYRLSLNSVVLANGIAVLIGAVYLKLHYSFYQRNNQI